MNNNKKRALIYTRVSHEEQVKYGYSLDAQRESLQQYCHDNNYTIIAEYTDEGISGGEYKKRKGLVKMISDAQPGDTILFTKLDRFSRNLLDANLIVQDLDAKSVSIKAIAEDDIDTTTADGRFIFNLKLSLAQREREKTSERIKTVFEHKDKKGEVTSGSVPFGYRIENKHLVIDTTAAEMVKFIFKTYDDTSNMSLTHKLFVQQYGNKRTYRAIRAMLSNEKYKGHHNGNTAYCEPLIDAELYDRVQYRLSQNLKTTPTHEKYIFSRLIVCPRCGAKLFAYTGHTTANTYHYYRCQNNSIQHGKSCDFTAVREDRIEAEVMDKIYVFAEEHKSRLRMTNKKDVSADISNIKAKINRLKELYIEGDIDKASYSLKLSDFKGELVKLEQIQATNKTTLIDELISLDVRELYDILEPIYRSALWHKYIKQILINDDGHVSAIDFLIDEI